MVEVNNKFSEAQEQFLQELETTDRLQCKSHLEVIKSAEDGTKYSTFCCLGIASKMFAPETRHTPSTGDTYHCSSYCVAYGNSSEALSDKLVEQLNMYGKWGNFTDDIAERPKVGKKILNSMSDMNDNGYSFKDIAKFIREQPWMVFTNFAVPD